MPAARLAVYGATAGVLAATGCAILGHPPPILLAGFLLGGYLTLLLGGVFVLQWRVFVDAVVRGPRDATGVAVTFDDGPHPQWTPRVLRMLASHRVPATFFVIGRKAEQWPEVIQAMIDGGHEVGLHSYEHDRLFALRSEGTVRSDLARGMAVLQSLTGRPPILFRPPIGHTNPRIARVAEQLGLVVVGWTVGGRDSSKSAKVRRVVERIRRRLANGTIVLLHDSAELGDHEPAALQALPQILDALRDMALPVVPLTQWVASNQSSAAGSKT
jgi:peptidoglycan-N-acetylglucosamine deacetylase